ncbi:hypothetical protein CfE428DRAFT_2902 [Chthoniobacter flavus Ellin428]|uniref:Uncharacterized protein n=1 Tax=Chthoniobacter flavus Ellin428 TaxID=497964 RepID=B4D1W4_9BACT|nr:hypothetical protein CfE428DRAFT_2902 [Chthoniobacter flavus Ellin428]TCO92957.1 hypothetical protein EV701_105234 [Chthoniobacter flavus]
MQVVHNQRSEFPVPEEAHLCSQERNLYGVDGRARRSNWIKQLLLVGSNRFWIEPLKQILNGFRE